MCVDQFPNMFMIVGPQGPLSVIPPAIEAECIWIGEVLHKARSQGYDRIEAKPAAARGWKEAVDNSAVGTVLADADKIRSWYMGANVDGKAHVMQFYVGGFKDFADRLDSAAASDFAELEFSVFNKEHRVGTVKQSVG
jgi:cyclohexanone monooxygenase